MIRTEQISENGQKTLLSRDEAIYKIDDATGVVEGANLIHNEYGTDYSPIFLYNWLSMVFTYFQESL